MIYIHTHMFIHVLMYIYIRIYVYINLFISIARKEISRKQAQISLINGKTSASSSNFDYNFCLIHVLCHIVYYAVLLFHIAI